MLIRATLLCVLLVGVTAAASPSTVEDSSYATANSDRAQRLSIVVPARPAAVWKALDSSEGWSSWAVSVALVDFRPGGLIETSYDPAARPGDRDNIKNQILAIVPERLLAFRNVQAPRNFKDPELFGRVTSVIELQPAGPKATRVTISGIGYGQGPAWDALYAQFLAGNSYSLEKLKTRFQSVAVKGRP